MSALEFVPRLPVPLLAVSALGARTRGIARVDRDDRDAGEGRLVGDERAELVERPARETTPLCLASRCPTADPREVFAADRVAGVFGLGDESFADDVVLVGPEAGLSHAGLVEPPLGSPGPGPLAGLADPVVATATCLDVVAAEVLAVVGRRQVLAAHVDADAALDLDL